MIKRVESHIVGTVIGRYSVKPDSKPKENSYAIVRAHRSFLTIKQVSSFRPYECNVHEPWFLDCYV